MCSIVSDSLQPHGLWPTRLLWPWDFSGENTGVGCHFLLQRIFLIQGSNLPLLCLLHCRWILYPLNHWGSPEQESISIGKPIDYYLHFTVGKYFSKYSSKA